MFTSDNNELAEMVQDFCKRNGATITKRVVNGDISMFDITTKGGKQWCLDVDYHTFLSNFIFDLRVDWQVDIYNNDVYRIKTIKNIKTNLSPFCLESMENALSDKADFGRLELLGKGTTGESRFTVCLFLLQTKEICGDY